MGCLVSYIISLCSHACAVTKHLVQARTLTSRPCLLSFCIPCMLRLCLLSFCIQSGLMSTRGSARGTAGQEKRAGQALQVNSTLVHVVNVAISDTPTASDSIQLRIILDCGGREDAPTEALFDVMGTLQVAGFASNRSRHVAEVLDSLFQLEYKSLRPSVCMVAVGKNRASSWVGLKGAIAIIMLNHARNIAEAVTRVGKLLQALEQVTNDDQVVQDELDAAGAIERNVERVPLVARRYAAWLSRQTSGAAAMRHVASLMAPHHNAFELDLLLGLATSKRTSALALAEEARTGATAAKRETARKSLRERASEAWSALRRLAVSKLFKVEAEALAQKEEAVQCAREEAERRREDELIQQGGDEVEELSSSDNKAIREAGNEAAKIARSTFEREMRLKRDLDIHARVESVAQSAPHGTPLWEQEKVLETLFEAEDPETNALLDEMFRTHTDKLILLVFRIASKQVVSAVLALLHDQYAAEAEPASLETKLIANLSTRVIDGALRRAWQRAAAVYEMKSMFVGACRLKELAEEASSKYDLMFTPADAPPSTPLKFAWADLESTGASFDPLQTSQFYLNHPSVASIFDINDQDPEDPVFIFWHPDGRMDAWQRCLSSFKFPQVRATALSSHGNKSIALSDTGDHVDVLPHMFRIFEFFDKCDSGQASLKVRGVSHPVVVFMSADGVALKELLMRNSALSKNPYVHSDAPKTTTSDLSTWTPPNQDRQSSEEMWAHTFGVLDHDEPYPSKEKIDAWARAYCGNRGLSPCPIPEVRCFKGTFHAAFTPSSTLVLLLGLYGAKLGILEQLNHFWKEHLGVPTKFLQLADGKVVIGLRGNGMRKLHKANENIINLSMFETELDEDEWFPQRFVEAFGLLWSTWVRVCLTLRSPLWDVFEAGLKTFVRDINLVCTLTVDLFGSISPTLRSVRDFFPAFIVLSVRIGVSIGLTGEDGLEHKHTTQHEHTRRHAAGGKGSQRSRREGALRYILTTEKLREDVMEVRAMETLLLHLGVIEAERKAGGDGFGRYPQFRRATLPALGIFDTQNASVAEILEPLLAKDRAAKAKRSAAAPSSLPPLSPPTSPPDEPDSPVAQAAAASPGGMSEEQSGEAFSPTPAVATPGGTSKGLPETPGGLSAAGAARAVETDDEDLSEHEEDDAQLTWTPAEEEEEQEKEVVQCETLLEEMGMPEDEDGHLPKKALAVSPFEIKNVVAIQFGKQRFETHGKASLKLVWSRQYLTVNGRIGEGCEIHRVTVPFACISSIGKGAAAVTSTEDGAAAAATARALVIGLCHSADLHVWDETRAKQSKKAKKLGDWARRLIGPTEASMGSQFTIELATDADLLTTWAVLSSERHDPILAELSKTPSALDPGFDNELYEANKKARLKTRKMPVIDDFDRALNLAELHIQEARSGDSLTEDRALTCMCMKKVFLHDTYIIHNPKRCTNVALKDMCQVIASDDDLPTQLHGVCMPLPVVRIHGKLEAHVECEPRRWPSPAHLVPKAKAGRPRIIDAGNDDEGSGKRSKSTEVASALMAKAPGGVNVESSGAAAASVADTADECPFCGKKYQKIKQTVSNPMGHRHAFVLHVLEGNGCLGLGRPARACPPTEVPPLRQKGTMDKHALTPSTAEAYATALPKICKCAMCQTAIGPTTTSATSVVCAMVVEASTEGGGSELPLATQCIDAEP